MMAYRLWIDRLIYGAPAELFEEDTADLPDYAERDLDL